METKEYILTNATQFLNRQGATGSSMRQLAAYLEMSDGNLRYHFSSKEKLLNAIVQQMLGEMQLIAAEDATVLAVSSLRQVREQLRGLFYTMYRYNFIFLEATLLTKFSSSISTPLAREVTFRKIFLQQLLQVLQRQGHISVAPDELALQKIVEQMFIISDNWLRYIDLEKKTSASIDKRIDYFIDLCLAPVEHYLTEEARLELLS